MLTSGWRPPAGRRPAREWLDIVGMTIPPPSGTPRRPPNRCNSRLLLVRSLGLRGSGHARSQCYASKRPVIDATVVSIADRALAQLVFDAHNRRVGGEVSYSPSRLCHQPL